MSKTTAYDRREILRLAKQGFSNLYLANRFGVSPSTIDQIKRERWMSGTTGRSNIRGLNRGW